MSDSLRDQLLKAGLISKQQANDAERQQQHRERQQARQAKTPPRDARSRPQVAKSTRTTESNPAQTPVPARRSAASPAPRTTPASPLLAPLPDRSRAPLMAQSAKVARDLELNRKQQEKAEKRARVAQIKQLVDQHRIPPSNGDAYFNFTDGAKIRRIAIDPPNRERLFAGQLIIVGQDGRYDLVPAAIAERIRERDPNVFMVSASASAASSTPKTSPDEGYEDHPIPDDLIW